MLAYFPDLERGAAQDDELFVLGADRFEASRGNRASRTGRAANDNIERGPSAASSASRRVTLPNPLLAADEAGARAALTHLPDARFVEDAHELCVEMSVFDSEVQNIERPFEGHRLLVGPVVRR